MEILSFLLVLAIVHVCLLNVVGLRSKRRIRNDDEHAISSPQQEPDEEAQPPCGVDTSASNTDTTQPANPKRKKKGGSSKYVPICRYCSKEFGSPQALGGHMNCHREERKNEEFLKAQMLVQKRSQNFASRFSSGSAMGSSYYQSGSGSGNHYQGQGVHMANPFMMSNIDNGGLRNQAMSVHEQQFVQQMKPNYDRTLQQASQYNNYQVHSQQRDSYGPYNNNPRLVVRQYQGQHQMYGISHGSSTTGNAHYQSNISFNTNYDSSQDARGAHPPSINTTITLGTQIGSNSVNPELHQSSISNQTIAQSTFDNQFGSTTIPRPSHATIVHPLNQSHFEDVSISNNFNHGSSQGHYIEEDFYNVATIGLENQFNASSVMMSNFEDGDKGDEFLLKGEHSNSNAVTELRHGGNGN